MSVLIEELHRKIAGWRRERLQESLLPACSLRAALDLAEVVLAGRGDAGTGGAAGLLDTLGLLEVAHRGEHAGLLGAAESLSAELVADLSARVAARGWSDGVEPILPPMAWAESVPSPLVWRRDLRLPVPSLAGHLSLRLPFPLIVLPTDHGRMPWRLASVAHEVGHAADAAFGLAARVRAACADGRAARLADPDWLDGWLGEVVADLVGLAGVGPVIGEVLGFVVDGLGVPRRSGDRRHPPLDHRLALLRRAWSVLAGVEDRLDDVPPALAADVGALVGSDVLGLAPVLRAGPPEGSWAALPAQALEAARRQGPGDPREPAGPEAEAAAWAVFRSPRPRPSTPGEETLAALRGFWGARVPRLAPTSFELTGSLLKRPPAALFALYDELVVVGATHRDLVGALDAAFAARAGQRWRRVEVYFAGRDEDLPRIYAGEQGDFAGLRARVRAGLPEALARFAEQSFVGEHPSWSLLASFLYQPPAPGLEPARWYVHTSAPVWGQSVRVAPSADYHSVSGDLSGDPEIRTLLAGLAHLRREVGCGLPFPGEG